MTRQRRAFRIIPLVLFATICLAALKIVGLVSGDGFLFPPWVADAPPPGRLSWAQEMFKFPAAGRISAAEDDVTGSVTSEKSKGPAAPEPPPPPPDGVVILPEQTKSVSSSERAILERLQARRQELEARARELEIRENLLKAAEKRLDSRMEELKGVEARISAANDGRAQAESMRLKGLVSMYENMKPKEAAKVFDRLEMNVLYDLSSQMNPRRMSDILAQMQPQVAEKLTIEIARRATGDRGGDNVNALPKIEGRPTPPSPARKD